MFSRPGDDVAEQLVELEPHDLICRHSVRGNTVLLCPPQDALKPVELGVEVLQAQSSRSPSCLAPLTAYHRSFTASSCQWVAGATMRTSDSVVTEDGHERVPKLPWRPVLTRAGGLGDAAERSPDVGRRAQCRRWCRRRDRCPATPGRLRAVAVPAARCAP
jgi:hypothetical protein